MVSETRRADAPTIPPRRPWTMMGVALVALGLLATGIYFKATSTRGFNPLDTLPLVSPSMLPDEVRLRLDCPSARTVVRVFDLNRDGTFEFFVQCLDTAGAPSAVTVWALRG